uniref:FBD domain-containing protein n=1 Tax=Brassica campestris TaxID=3711 RepID=A0A3P5ZB16_BRACM|nr:unnamed protein product [Brassica rapa]
MPGEDRISALHDDLLLKILSQVPTKDAVTTMVFRHCSSKRWGLVWTMVPKLEYTDRSKEGENSIWRLIDKSFQLHKAPVLEILRIQIDHYQFSNDADIGNALVVDVPSLPCLPLLDTLALLGVVFKDESSHVRLLSNCPALSYLCVHRNMSDNVTRFIVKVPSLKSFTYSQRIRASARPLVLDSPGLQRLSLSDRDLDSIHYMPHLDWADVSLFAPYPKDDKFLRFFSSVKVLRLSLRNAACCSAIKFPRLMKFTLHLGCLDDDLECSLEPLMLFLHNSPILKVLRIDYDVALGCKDLPLSWNQQSSVPGCLLSHLEIFVWEGFGGRRQERECVAYILANSKCLKTARISPICYYNFEEKEKIAEDIKSMYRVSASSQLITH